MCETAKVSAANINKHARFRRYLVTRARQATISNNRDGRFLKRTVVKLRPTARGITDGARVRGRGGPGRVRKGIVRNGILVEPID